ncbi:MAG: hypothetical protein ACOC0N_06880 [Chroococcales cyanobacterium]
MKLSLLDNTLNIEWEWYEQLLAFTWDNPLKIPLFSIRNVTTEEPPSSWREIRAPGTALPGVIKAGTYYTPRGKEFWYVLNNDKYLVLELENEPYKKVVLTIDENEYWKDRIDQNRLL